MVKLNALEVRVLAAALRHLSAGDGRRFDDVLWLGLGDDSARLWDALISHRYIDFPGTVWETRLTPRGHHLLARLRESVALVA